MDCSISGYLSRRSAEELKTYLDFCLREENADNYKQSALAVLAVLEKCGEIDIVSGAEKLLMSDEFQNDQR